MSEQTTPLDFQPTLVGDILRLRPLMGRDRNNLFSAVSDPLIWEQHPANRHEPAVFRDFFAESLSSGSYLVVDLATRSDRVIYPYTVATIRRPLARLRNSQR